jgi:hypothetical protein
MPFRPALRDRICGRAALSQPGSDGDWEHKRRPPKLRRPPTHELGAEKCTPARQAVELDISELTRIYHPVSDRASALADSAIVNVSDESNYVLSWPPSLTGWLLTSNERRGLAFWLKRHHTGSSAPQQLSAQIPASNRPRRHSGNHAIGFTAPGTCAGTPPAVGPRSAWH